MPIKRDKLGRFRRKGVTHAESITIVLLVLISLVSYSWVAVYNLEADTIHYTATSTETFVSNEKAHTSSQGHSVEQINELIEQYASKYGVSSEIMKNVIDCESNYRPEVRSQKTYSHGAQERSYGLVQIHLPSHPQVSYEEATDPEYAVKFMAQHFATGNHHLWTCFNMIYDS